MSVRSSVSCVNESEVFFFQIQRAISLSIIKRIFTLKKNTCKRIFILKNGCIEIWSLSERDRYKIDFLMQRRTSNLH